MSAIMRHACVLKDWNASRLREESSIAVPLVLSRGGFRAKQHGPPRWAPHLVARSPRPRDGSLPPWPVEEFRDWLDRGGSFLGKLAGSDAVQRFKSSVLHSMW